jgi:hypothetical protein
MLKYVTWAIVIIVVIAGLWYFFAGSSNSGSAPATGAPSGQETGAQGSASANDTSDAQLQQDLNAANGQVDAAGSANASASSFSDSPVPQTE